LPFFPRYIFTKEKRNIKVHATSGTQETAGTPCRNIGNRRDSNIANGNSSRDVCNSRNISNCIEFSNSTKIGGIASTVWSDFKIRDARKSSVV
jgi:hypothetical protein